MFLYVGIIFGIMQKQEVSAGMKKNKCCTLSEQKSVIWTKIKDKSIRGKSWAVEICCCCRAGSKAMCVFKVSQFLWCKHSSVGKKCENKLFMRKLHGVYLWTSWSLIFSSVHLATLSFLLWPLISHPTHKEYFNCAVIYITEYFATYAEMMGTLEDKTAKNMPGWIWTARSRFTPLIWSHALLKLK